MRQDRAERRTVVLCDGTGRMPRARPKGSCAQSVGEVNDKVETLGQSIEATQQQTKENAARIEQVDQKADQAGTAAQTAQTSATAARSRGGCRRGEGRGGRDCASKRLIFEVVISDDQGNFELGKADLPDDVRAKLDELATQAQGRSGRQLHRDRGAHRLDRRRRS